MAVEILKPGSHTITCPVCGCLFTFSPKDLQYIPDAENRDHPRNKFLMIWCPENNCFTKFIQCKDGFQVYKGYLGSSKPS